MSELDNVQHKVEQVRHSVAAAAAAVKVARQKTGDKAETFGQLGLEGVRACLDTAAQLLETGSEQLGAGHYLVNETVTVLGRITDTTNLDDTITALTEAEQNLGDGGAEIRAAMATVGTNAFNYAQETEVKAPIVRISAAVEAIAETANAIGTAITAIRDYRDKIQQAIRATTNRVDTSTTAPRTTATMMTDEDIPGFNPDRRHEKCVDAIKRIGWPKSKDGKTKARGLLYDTTGRSKLHKPLRALRKGDRYATPDLKEPWRSNPDISTTWHIEGGVATYMRQTRTREMVLYLNVPPCGSASNPDSRGCDQNIRAILPRGYTLYVHSVKQNGWHDRTKYTGTGEAIS